MERPPASPEWPRITCIRGDSGVAIIFDRPVQRREERRCFLIGQFELHAATHRATTYRCGRSLLTPSPAQTAGAHQVPTQLGDMTHSMDRHLACLTVMPGGG
jgi:hypothetical protein